MKAQLGGHFRGRPAAVEPQLHRVLFELRIEFLPELLGLNHRLIHNLTSSYCRFLPVSAKSAQPHYGPMGEQFDA